MFENEYTLDRALIREYVLRVLALRTILAGVLLFLAGLVLFSLYESGIRYGMLFCAFLGLFCVIVSPIMMIGNLEQTSKRLNNGRIEKTRIVFADVIVMQEGAAHLEFSYRQITRILQTRHLIVLQMGRQAAILAHKDGFLQGSPETFLPFIRKQIEFDRHVHQ